MNIFDYPLKELSWYEESKRCLEKKTASIRLTGASGIEKAHIINSLAADFKAAIVVVENDLKARSLYEDCKFFNKNVMYYPAKDLIFYQADINGKQIIIDRMQVIRKILSGEAFTIITTIDAFMAPAVPVQDIYDNRISLEKGGIVEEAALAIKLTNMGYTKVPQTQDRGDFSIRGGIVDIFDLTEENPYRIELWGDQVDSIRSFDVMSQRSIEELDNVTILPASELMLTNAQKEAGFHRMKLDADQLIKTFRENGENEKAFRVQTHIDELKVHLLETDMGLNLESYIYYFYDETGSFIDLFNLDETCIFIDEPEKVVLHGGNVEYEFNESMQSRLEKGYILPKQSMILRKADEVVARLQKHRLVGMSLLVENNPVFSYEKDYAVSARSLSSYNGSFRLLVNELGKLKKAGSRVVIVSPSRTRAMRLAEDLTDEGVIASFTEDTDKVLQKGEIFTVYGHLRTGFEYPEIKFTVISEADIFGSDKKKKRRKPKYTGGQKVASYDDLKVGDYVIHENHGLGIYRGIEKLEVEHIEKDYMKIEYRDGGNLYVLASNFDKVQFYAGADSKKHKLNKLGSSEWAKTKSKVEVATRDIAKELVHLYAVRSEKNGHKFGKDTVWQKEFEEMFPFEETDDQLEAIAATKDDMESTKIMDRLVCGDVGFGKTEVAIRAAFKAVQEGKQVAYLVPTTILAQQHYNTFAERMKQYPVKVRPLSRFCTAKEVKQTLSDLKKGLVDIVIGTHRILSKDVEFKDLGLLIVDEEQRFGVNHKERIKGMKENVDVLTLTATPIPRTLHMSLVGIRDMSLLEEPPLDRLPIQTYVMEYNEEMVREAINRELGRGGQVYYVYNKVNDIDIVADTVAKLVPDARVAYAHGQMKESELEVIMMEFVNHEIDVLVSTTIIETGLDIPNVNTMIIHDSDQLGLSQLYQLRGRVGRSNRTSFAFLMYQRNKLLKETAEKRLAAIKEFTELGSGFKIAMRDLEIRGAGNLLGKAQHGHMEAVGYDLYCRMLEEAIRYEQGERTVSTSSATVDLDVGAFIPAEYIVNESQKLDMYKRIASIENDNDISDMMDEMRDRFGSVPVEARYLLRVACIKQRATKLHISEVRGRAGRIRCVMDPKAPVQVEKIPFLLNEYGGNLRLNTKSTPEFVLLYQIVGLVEKDEELLLEKMEDLLDKMNMLYEDNSVDE